MNLDFPIYPTNGDTYTVNGIVYRYDASITAWLIDSYTSGDTIVNSFIQANLAYAQANSAFDAANNVAPQIAPTYTQANTARDHANASFVHANASFVHANAAFDAANNVAPQIAPTYEQANTARDHANSAFASSNAVNAYSDSTYVKLTAATQTITGNLSVVGFLSVSGNTIFLDATRLEIDDPLIYLAGNNYTSDIVDIGFIANYVNATGQNVHTGLYREHEDKEYYLFQGYDKEPINNHIGALSNNMTLAVLNADLRTSNLILGGANAILTIGASFDKANTANITADLAFNKANAANVLAFNALPNTSGVSFNGNLTIPGELTLGTNLNFDTSFSTKIVDPAANTLAFHTTQTERMRIDSSGNIGIGTNAPIYSLEVRTAAGTSSQLGIRTGNSSASSVLSLGQIGAIGWDVGITATTGHFQIGINGGGLGYNINRYGTGISFHSWFTDGSERMRVDPKGNVLIGRTDSTVGNQVKLDVNGKVNAAGILINGAAFSTAPRVLSLASNTSPFVWNSNTYDQICFTALGNALTINADSGSPVDGQKIIFRFKPSGAQTLTWTTGATKAFRALGITLPTSLVSAKTVYVGCIYNATDQRWDAVAVSVEP